MQVVKGFGGDPKVAGSNLGLTQFFLIYHNAKKSEFEVFISNIALSVFIHRSPIVRVW